MDQPRRKLSVIQADYDDACREVENLDRLAHQAIQRRDRIAVELFNAWEDIESVGKELTA